MRGQEILHSCWSCVQAMHAADILYIAKQYNVDIVVTFILNKNECNLLVMVCLPGEGQGMFTHTV